MNRKATTTNNPINIAPPKLPTTTFQVAIASVFVSAIPKKISRYPTTPKMVKAIMPALLVILKPVSNLP